MSKLLDKLRSATRSRDATVSIGKPLDSGLLSHALRRAQAERAALRAANEQLEVPNLETQSAAVLELERVEQQVEAALQAAIIEDRQAESPALARAQTDRLLVEPPAQPQQPAVEPRAAAPRATAPQARDRRTRAMIIALVVMALVAAAAAWNHAAPPTQPEALKLDYGLDVTRMDASRQSSPPDRARSK